ncbi:TPA: two-partner secretion system exoprotein TpsA4 [Pseudomonas aeruginosa]|uniref:two-partner secretion system exoprotein TpsA4 n=1 Tax=Pseudomonas aeruginosa TaxID=287 RepID=UPI002B26AE68|nr:two-partner secretion system exoprotein TpsA4 [Pseudomonas aeruginosa]MEA8510000.1 two-partner secretion system exoprotein TpsA4 [Pseudomonas aeruginosa]MEA8582956.1 two-partner secretion system exoprotein TpsA4 [Pseudomonas aeruginosa]HBO6187105.1 two-partner secretion system exoprotein TpsA4 [Pseudomonas aeruginosa]HBP1267940.1 two-partner secretion system exoprotein TpsA4 [Pseudomonas aeruginosa]HCG0604289.1 two-partner secretion system exoprotein TpsA4 [Pseudomonas aeruginosa]
MNKSYTLVWNQATGCWNVASEGTRRRSKSGRGKALVVAGASLLGLFCQAPAFALPSGATVVSGDAGFQTSTDGRHMVIDQQSHKLITNWNEFSVRADERVSFHQPGQDAVALNRVIGRNGSDIQGRIDANGKVFLVNPNGVVFGKSAQVNVGGLVASTLDLADRDFLAGNYQFSGDSGATVSNAGSLQASEGGSIALLGARVSNDGVIQAQLGDVALGAGQGINLNFDGDGLLNLQVDKGSVDALAHNGGLIRADGGQVLMSARSADSLLKTVVNNQGTLEARTLRSAEGRIVLDGGEQGTVRVAGKQDASAIGGGNGGLVLNQGANVEIQRTAQVDTHADQGATGTWRILSHEVSVAAVGQANAAGDGSGQVHVAQGPAGANASDSNGVTIVQQQPAVDLAAGANGTSAVQSQSGANIGSGASGISVVQSQNSPNIGSGVNGVTVVQSQNGANIGSGASGITVVQSQNGANIGSGASGISVVQSQSGPSIGSGVNGVTIVQSQSGANIGPGVSGIDVVQTQTLPNLSPGANGSSIVQVQTLPDIAADAGNVHVMQVQTGGNKVFGNSATNVRSRTVQARSNENVGSGLANPSSAGKGPTLHADTLARNLSTSNVEVVATRSNAHVGAPLSWDSGNGLTLTAERGDLRINGALTAQGENASLTLNAGQRPLRIDNSLSLTGQGARVEFNSDKGYALAEGARITLSGKNAGFRANGRDYSVIQDLQQLRGIDRDLGGSYVLGNRIAGGNSSFLSIGNASAFGGTFDGLGNTIDNLAVYGTGAYSGLFSVNRGTLRNLNLERISADGAQATHYNVQVGSLAAVNLGRIDNVNASDIRIAAASQLNSLGGLVALNLGSIDNASASGTLVGNRHTYALGGLAAENISTARGVASISNSRADFAISGQLKDHASHYGAGGLVGRNRGGLIRSSGSQGTLSLSGHGMNLGGLVGYSSAGGLADVSASVDVSGNGQRGLYGGLIGLNVNSGIAHATASGKVRGTDAEALGGLIGRNLNAAINNASAHGDVSLQAGRYLGGLIGHNQAGNLANVSASGNLSGGSLLQAGGLIGLNANASLVNASAKGNVATRGAEAVGGLLGENLYGSVINGSASGEVTDGSGKTLGGLIGSNLGGNHSNLKASGWVNAGANSDVGGLIGHNRGGNHSTLAASGNVTGGKGSRVGGLVGYNDAASLTNVSASGNVNASGSRAIGGLIGSDLRGSLMLASSHGIVNDKTGHNLGGLVGRGENTSIRSAKASGAVSGGAGIRAGGLVGSLEGWQALILGASAGGDVTAGYDSYIGGLVGFSTATISGASASGKVGGSGLLGGLVAWNQGNVMGSSASGRLEPQIPNQIHGGLIGINFGWQSWNSVYGAAATVPMIGRHYNL